MIIERRNIANGNDARDAHVRREADGALIVEGRDHGPPVQDVFGPNVDVYEWTIRVPANQIRALMEALGRPGDDPLEAVAEWFRNETRAFEPYLDGHGVVHESWSLAHS